ncbi:hypothetical protein CVT25_008091 [Psilocybe cyanescens]|uniref:G domain-containing protein n=1 Tax=Psilocybe cyanescens TaxID=93625 RepID=A0A409X6N2_PSICY|nr:hypothetical protein CVT25_008091 [Psilocybe cyanescens]
MSANRQNPAKESKVKALGNRLKKSIGLGSYRTASPPATGQGSSGAMTVSAVEEAAKLRAKYKHFRILVIGRANAGKTTLLKRVCNTTEEPSIYNKGKNLRGTHDIRQAFTFKSNPKFIFHDSAGFEAGGEEELKAVMDFIEEGSKACEVNDQIHMIWYVFTIFILIFIGSTSNDSGSRFCFDPDVSRPLLDLEVKFFNENRKWNVPVVAIFMKFDDLISQVWDRNNTAEQNTMHALETLQEKFEQPLRRYQFPPQAYVQLEGLDKNESGHQKQIEVLMKQTAASINDLALKMLFVTVQQNNLNMCIGYAIKNIVYENITKLVCWLRCARSFKWLIHIKDNLILYAIIWFPHYYYVSEYAAAL